VDEHGEGVALAQAAHKRKTAATLPSRICSAPFGHKHTGEPCTSTWPPLYCVSNSAWSIPVTKDSYKYEGWGGIKEDRLNIFHIHVFKKYLNLCSTPTNVLHVFQKAPYFEGQHGQL
jgi:hypothetical protein